MKLITVDSSRGPVIIEAEIAILNLNALVRRDYEISKLIPALSKLVNYQEVNFNNLASLCAKLKIKYGSKRCIEILKNVIQAVKQVNPSIKIVQKGLVNCFEEDIRPFKKLSLVEDDKVKVVKYVKDAIKLLGFVDAQILSFVKDYPNYLDKLPQDCISHIPYYKTCKAIDIKQIEANL